MPPRPLYAARLAEQLRQPDIRPLPRFAMAAALEPKYRRTLESIREARLSRLRNKGLSVCAACGSDWPPRELAKGCPTCRAANMGRRQ